MANGFEAENGKHAVIEAILTTIDVLKCPLENLNDQFKEVSLNYETLCAEELNDKSEETYFCDLKLRISKLLSQLKDEL